jgi:hypothetical protein
MGTRAVIPALKGQRYGAVSEVRFRGPETHLLVLALPGFDLGCVKTLRGITAPGILGSVVMRRAKKRKNLSFRSALRPNQISFSHSQDPTETLAAKFAVNAEPLYSMW